MNKSLQTRKSLKDFLQNTEDTVTILRLVIPRCRIDVEVTHLVQEQSDIQYATTFQQLKRKNWSSPINILHKYGSTSA